MTWVGHATSRVILGAAAFTVVIAAWAATRGETIAVIVCFVATAICLAMSRITVMIDRRGVTVLFSLLRWPRKVVPLDAITGYERTDLTWRTWKGWGYRKSKLFAGDSAILMRSGDGFRIDTAGTSLSISVDDSAGAVETLSDLLDTTVR